MKRRTFIAGLGSAAAWSLAAGGATARAAIGGMARYGLFA